MESKTVQLERTQYHYLEWANPGKPKILLIHGLKVESHCWEQTVAFLKDSFHIYAIDLKGHGKTQDGASYDPDYTLDQITNELHEFYKLVIQENFSIAGYSLGGQFAMHYAAQHGSNLNSLVLLDTAPDISALGVFFLLVLGAGKNREYNSRQEIIDGFTKHGHAEIGKYMAEYTAKDTEDGRVCYRFDVANISPATSKEYKARAAQLWKDLAAVNGKVVFLKAQKSQIVSRGIAKRMRRLQPDMISCVIPKVGHEMVFTAPEAVAKAIIDNVL